MARSAAKLSQFLAETAQLAASLRQRIEAEVQGFRADREAQKARQERAHADFGYFCQTYFPHYIQSPHRSALHEYLFKRLPEMVGSQKSENDAIAAPRGEAKSTIVSQLFVLWCSLTGRKHFIVIVMDSLDQATPMLEAIKAELEFNPRLSMDFPNATGPGRVWQVGVILTANGVKIQVAGSGKKLRGLRHGPHRPDLTVLDDIENDENVTSPAQRDKTTHWITKTVLPLGGAGVKYDVVYIGTILHYDSALSRTLNNPLWRTARFKAVIRWPDAMSLWEKWEEALRNLGEAVADAFYAAHQREMDAGAQVSWAQRPLVALMKIRARDGHAAFDSEYQNDPVSGEDAPFQHFTYWSEPDPNWMYFGAVDPSLGKAGASRDPSAILVGGFNRMTGVLSVVEADIKKRLPDRIIEDVIALHQRYRCVLWVVEAVQFQEFLRTELVKRSAARGCAVPARAVSPSADKLLRIESLQPHVSNGLIRFHHNHTTLLSQLKHFPKADHDDGPDALHMLWMAATSGFVRVEDFKSLPRHASATASRRDFMQAQTADDECTDSRRGF